MERKKKHRAAFDENEAFDQDDVGDEEYGDDSPPPQLPPNDHESPDEPPVKKRRLTGKQKYQNVSAHIAGVKNLISGEWIKHGEASSRQPAQKTEIEKKHYRRTDNLTSIIDEQRKPRII